MYLFSRRVHLVSCISTDIAKDSTEIFIGNFFKIHSFPESFVSDHDPTFHSKFWIDVMKLCGVRLRMSIENHLQTDGASEVMNRMFENYLSITCKIVKTIGIYCSL